MTAWKCRACGAWKSGIVEVCGCRPLTRPESDALRAKVDAQAADLEELRAELARMVAAAEGADRTAATLAHRIVEASRQGQGLRLSADECLELAEHDAIAATADDVADEAVARSTYASDPIPPGTMFGRWTVVGDAGMRMRYGVRRAFVVVECVCGLRRREVESALRAGTTTGCRLASCRSSWEVGDHEYLEQLRRERRSEAK